MPFLTITGVEQLDRNLRELGSKGAARASKAALTSAVRYLATQARGVAPVGKGKARQQKGGKRLKQSIRAKSVREAGHVVDMKVTVAARHGHLVVLGTRMRKRTGIGGAVLRNRRTQLVPRTRTATGNTGNTGRVIGNPFFRRSVQSNMDQARQILIARLKERIEAEAAKK